jgi:hypothetical protein
MHPGENKFKRARRDGEDSRVARLVAIATADRGPTTPAHAGVHGTTQAKGQMSRHCHHHCLLFLFLRLLLLLLLVAIVLRMQTDAEAGAGVEHAWWQQRGSPTRRRRRTHASQCPTRHALRRTTKATWLAAMGADSRAARDISVATADRGVTAPAHAGMHTYTGRRRRRRRRQTRMAATLREGSTHRRQRTHALSARDDIHPGAKQTASSRCGRLTSSSRCWIGHRRPRRNCALARARTQADAAL